MNIIKYTFKGRFYLHVICCLFIAALFAADASAGSIKSINVVGDGDAVMIETTEDVKYTVFKLQDPPRLIVDITGVDAGKAGKSITINNDFVSEISASDFVVAGKPMGRVVIGLKDNVSHVVKSGERSILVKLARGAGNEATGGNAAINKATSVLEIKTTREDGKTKIRIVTNGEVGNFNSFGFDEKASVVLDVWGVDSSLGKQSFDIESPLVKSVRVGEHEDKVRLVFSSMTDKVPNYRVEKSGNTIILTLGGDTAAKVVNIPEAEVKLQTVEVVDFVKFKDRARLTVTTSGKPRYSLKRSLDGKLLTIDILDATIPAELVRTVDAMALETPVMTISSYQSSRKPDHQVRILLRLKEDVPFNVFEDEDSITVDLSLTGQALVDEPGDDVKLASAKAELDKKVKAEAERMAALKKAEADKAARLANARAEEKVRAEAERAVVLKAEAERMARLAKAEEDEKVRAEAEKAAALKMAEAKKAARLAKAEADEKARVEAQRLVALKKSAALAEKEAKAEARRRARTIKKAEALMKAYADREFKTVKKSVEPERTVQAQLDEVLGSGETVDPEKKVYTGKRLDLDMVGVDIRDILKLIAEVSDLNIIAGEDVKGTITMRLKNVPWDQAFDLILLTKGLDKVQIGNVVRVASITKIRKEKEEALAAMNARKKVAPLVTEYIQINYEEASKLEKHIKEVLSDRGSVTSHKSTNTIIVRDVAENIFAAKDVVTKLDRVIPQVLIEARIVEAETSFARDLGIQWGLDYADQPHTNIFGSSDTFGQAPHDPSVRDTVVDSGGVVGGEKQNWPAMAGVTNYAVNLPATGVAGALGAMGFVFGTSGDNPAILDLRLTAGEQAGVLKTISRPRITTLDNKEAKIEQGESIPFETTSASGTATTFIDANLSLTVTPHITPDGSVLMKIKASRNSIGTFKTSSGEPSINKKEAMTEVLVKDGETTVIGGIVISDTLNSESGIPFLKDIPLLGWLFKSKSISDKQTELLIFITPTIIRNDATIG